MNFGIIQTSSGRFPLFRRLGEKVVQYLDGSVSTQEIPNELLESYPEFKGRWGFFANTNPASGALGMRGEKYGDVLFRIELKQSAVDRWNLLPRDIGRALDRSELSANLIYHRGNLQEWVVRDPSIIASFTADPELMKEDLERELVRLKAAPGTPEFSYGIEDFHVSDFNHEAADPRLPFTGRDSNLRNYAIYAISKFLKYGRVLVPREFLGRRDKSKPLPSPIRRIQLSNMMKHESETFELRQKWSFANSMLDRRILGEELIGAIVALTIQHALKEKLTTEWGPPTSDPEIAVRSERLIDAIVTGLGARVLNNFIYPHRYSQRYTEKMSEGNVNAPDFGKLSDGEAKELRELIGLAMSPSTTANDIIAAFASAFGLESSLIAIIDEKFNYHVSDPATRAELRAKFNTIAPRARGIGSCQGAFASAKP